MGLRLTVSPAISPQVLLGQGAEYRVEDRDKWTALHCAAKGTAVVV